MIFFLRICGHCWHAIHFDGCVAVQARQDLEETRWLLELAERHPFIKGVVGWVDLCSEHLPNQLQQFAGHPKLVGVRHIVHDEPDDKFMLRPDFRRGIAQLREFNLTYDLLLFPRHLTGRSAVGRRISGSAVCPRPHRQARDRRAIDLSLAGESAPPGEVPQRFLQAFRYGDGSRLEAVAAR